MLSSGVLERIRHTCASAVVGWYSFAHIHEMVMVHGMHGYWMPALPLGLPRRRKKPVTQTGRRTGRTPTRNRKMANRPTTKKKTNLDSALESKPLVPTYPRVATMPRVTTLPCVLRYQRRLLCGACMHVFPRLRACVALIRPVRSWPGPVVFLRASTNSI